MRTKIFDPILRSTWQQLNTPPKSMWESRFWPHKNICILNFNALFEDVFVIMKKKVEQNGFYDWIIKPQLLLDKYTQKFTFGCALFIGHVWFISFVFRLFQCQGIQDKRSKCYENWTTEKSVKFQKKLSAWYLCCLLICSTHFSIGVMFEFCLRSCSNGNKISTKSSDVVKLITRFFQHFFR